TRCPARGRGGGASWAESAGSVRQGAGRREAERLQRRSPAAWSPFGSTGSGLRRWRASARFGAEEREGDHVPDGGLVGQHHDHPVDSHPEAGGGGHAVLQGPDVVLVVV